MLQDKNMLNLFNYITNKIPNLQRILVTDYFLTFFIFNCYKGFFFVFNKIIIFAVAYSRRLLGNSAENGE